MKIAQTYLFILLSILILSEMKAQSPSFLIHAIETYVSPFKNEAILGTPNTNLNYGIQSSLGLKLNSTINFQLDVARISLYEELNMYSIALRSYRRTSKNLLGITLGYNDLFPYKSYILTTDFEKYANDLMTFTGSFLYEIKNLESNTYKADISFLLYFHDDLMLSSGIGLNSKFSSPAKLEAILRLEWLLPLGALKPLALKFRLGGHLTLETMVGLKYYFGRLYNLKAHHRTNGYYTTRFN